MGYVAMQPNDIASQYGNRTQAVQPLVKPNSAVEPVKFKQIARHKRNGQPRFPSRRYANHDPPRECERYFTGKGRRFDALA